MLWTAEQPYEFEDETLRKIDFENKRVIAVTCHRRENLGEYMGNIFTALADIAREYKDVEIVYPVHLNPLVRDAADKYLGGLGNVHLIEPLTYQPFTKLLQASYLVVTDSGGIQEEAPALGKPVLVVRKETERPEAVEAGTVRVIGTEEQTIVEEAEALLAGGERFFNDVNSGAVIIPRREYYAYYDCNACEYERANIRIFDFFFAELVALFK